MAQTWLPALRERFETKGLAARVRSSSVAYSVAGQPYASGWSTQRAVESGYLANPWIFRACEVIAHTEIRRRITLRSGEDPHTSPEVPMRQDRSRVLYCLNRRANPWETAKMLRYRLVVLWLLSPRGVPVEVSRSRAGRLAMLNILDPDLVDPIPSRNNPISAFEVRTTGDTGGGRDILPAFDPEDRGQTNSVLWLRSPHPTMIARGMSAMQPAGLSVELDRYARLYNRDYMQAGGRPGGILGVRGQVTPETLTTLQDRFNRDSRPGETSAIQADAMFYQDLSTSPRDMQWGEVMDRMKHEASMVFGVPESMMGDASGSTFDNADAEYAIFLEHRFAPLIELIDDQLDLLTGGYDDDLWLRHDLSDLWVLKRHRRAEEDRQAEELRRGTITMNEYRAFLGLPGIDAPWANVHWFEPNKAAGHDGDATIADEAVKAPILSPGGGGGAPPPDPGGDPGQQGGDQGGGFDDQGGGFDDTGGGFDDTGGGPLALPSSGFGDDDDVSGPRDSGREQLTLAHARPGRGLEGKQSRARDHRPAPAARWQ